MAESNKNHILGNIKSNVVLKKITDNLKEIKLLKLMKINKLFQNKLNIGIDSYIKYYHQIKIEIIPLNKTENNKFINIPKEKESYYHVYFNDEKEEINRD